MRSLVTVVFILCLSASSVYAQGKVDVSARNNEAVQLSKDGEYLKAIEVWLDLVEKLGDEHEYAWAFHMSIGRNFQKLLMYPEAWWHLNHCVQITKGQKSKPVKWLTDVEDALSNAYTKVVVVVAAAGGEVGFKYGSLMHWYKAPLTWWMKPGETGMTIKAEGKKVQVKKLEVTLDTKEVVLQFGTSPELGVLGVRVDQPEAKIYIGTTELGKGEVRRTAKPGTYVVRVVLEGFQEWTQTVDIEAGRTVESSVMLRPLDFDKPGSQKKSAAWKWAILGSAVALAAAGGGTYAVASKNLDTERTSYNKWLVDTYHLDGKVPDTKAAQDEATKEWDDRVASGVTPMQVASYALWGVAGAAAVTGAILLVTHDSGGADAKSSLYVPTVSPVMLPGNGAGAMLNITF